METFAILETFDPDAVLAAAKERGSQYDQATYALNDDCGFGPVIETSFWVPIVYRIETGFFAQVSSGTGWQHAAGTHATLNEAAVAAHEKAAELKLRYEETDSEFDDEDDDDSDEE